MREAGGGFKNPLYEYCLTCKGPKLVEVEERKVAMEKCITNGCNNPRYTKAGLCKRCHFRSLAKLPRKTKQETQAKDNGKPEERMSLERIMPLLFPEGVLIKTPEQWQALKQLIGGR